jgi:hypothetical protein
MDRIEQGFVVAAWAMSSRDLIPDDLVTVIKARAR